MAEDMMDLDTPDLAASLETVLTFGTQASVTAVPYPKSVLENLVYSLEEGMASKALDFLAQVSYAGISTPCKPTEKSKKKEIAIPPPEVLSVITTLSLHPTYTTRQVGLLETDVAVKASRYLRTITRLAGATNCQLQHAWRFKRCDTGSTQEDTNTRRRTRNKNVAKTGAVARKGRQKAQHEIDVTPFANLDIANEENMFNRCDDIWSVIGWALVCSCVYKKRWDVWRDFLELLIETLQTDFQERVDAAPDPKDMDIQGTLITAVGLLPDLAGGAGYKRIVRAIFANGSEKSRNEWTPVFPKETKKPPKKEYKKWKHTLDNNNLYAAKNRGDTDDTLLMIRENAVKDFSRFRNNVNDNSDAYKDFREQLAADQDFADDESEDDSGIRPAKKEDKTKLETHEEALETWGGVQAIVIRLKLMALLTYTFAYDIPTLSCFYTEYTDILRSLPIKQLTLFLSPSIYPCPENPGFRGTLLATILQRSMVFQPPGGWNEAATDDINDDVLREWYFPHYARGNDVEAQVRMGSVLEALARLWHVNTPHGKGIRWTKEMDEAVESGIKVRRTKALAAFKRKKVPTEADEELMKMLGIVEARLRMLMRVAKGRTLGGGGGG